MEIVALFLVFAVVAFVGWATFKVTKWMVGKVDNLFNKLNQKVKPNLKRVK